MRKMNVKLVCTTEGPLDTLEHHKKIAAENLDFKVHAAFRPDKALLADDIEFLNGWIDKLSEVADVYIKSFTDLLQALKKRHDFIMGKPQLI